MSSYPVQAPIPDPGILNRRSILALHVRAAELSHLPIATVPGIATPVFSRASENVGRDRNGAIYIGAHSQPVIECFDLDGDGIFETPTLVFDDARTNLVPYGSDYGTTWNGLFSPTVTVAADSLGEMLLARIQDTNGSQIAILQSGIMTSRFSTNGNGVVLGYVAIGQTPPTGSSGLVLRDTTNSVNRMELTWVWNGTAPVVTVLTGTLLWTRFIGISAGGRSVWEIAAKPTGTLTTADHKYWVIPCSTASEQGDAYFGPAHVEDLTTCPGPLVFNTATTAATYTREAWGLATDAYCGPVTFFVDFIERGSIYTTGARLISITNAALGNPQIAIDVNSGVYRLVHHNGTTSVQSLALSAPSVGDRVQLYGTVDATGAAQLSQSIITPGTQGAFIAGLASAANAFAKTYAGFSGSTHIYLGHPTATRQATRLIVGKLALAAKTNPQMQAAY